MTLAALGITESVEELRHPRAELAFGGDRIAAPILPAPGDPAAVELLSSLSRHARSDDEFLSTSLESAPSDSRSGHFEVSIADDRGPAGVLVGDADHVIVTYAVLAEPCTRASGHCRASGVSYRVYAADGTTLLETGAAISRDGLWIIAVGPIEVAVVVHDVGWLQPG